MGQIVAHVIKYSPGEKQERFTSNLFMAIMMIIQETIEYIVTNSQLLKGLTWGESSVKIVTNPMQARRL